MMFVFKGRVERGSAASVKEQYERKGEGRGEEHNEVLRVKNS